MAEVEHEPIRIVISYRRLDTAGHAGHLNADLLRRFGEGRVFLDIDSIEPGLNFRQVIEDAIVGSDVLIVLIGRGWLTASDQDGRRRIDKEDDPLRFEVELGLRSNVRVVPVLVQGAKMPEADELPESLAELADLNAYEISDRRWGDDVDELATFLGKLGREKARRLAAPDVETLAEERVRKEAASRDIARRREEALLQQSLREEVERRRLRERDLVAQLEASTARQRWWRRAAVAVVAAVAVLAGVAAAGSVLPDGRIEETVTVSARLMWNDTGIELERGQKVRIVASGTIDTHQPDPARRSGPEGKAGEVGVPANIVKDIGHGALIRRIGDGEPRGVGAASEFTAENGGRLYLGVNDWNFETNGGFFRAVVTVD